VPSVAAIAMPAAMTATATSASRGRVGAFGFVFEPSGFVAGAGGFPVGCFAAVPVGTGAVVVIRSPGTRSRSRTAR